jgi:hypothetical protein
MNSCPKGHAIPEKALACPACAAERGEKAFHDLQIEFLRKAMKGVYSYSLRVVKGNDRHVLMYSSYSRTFCGKELESRPHIHYEAYDEDTLAKLCAGCRSVIASMVEEMR